MFTASKPSNGPIVCWSIASLAGPARALTTNDAPASWAPVMPDRRPEDATEPCARPQTPSIPMGEKADSLSIIKGFEGRVSGDKLVEHAKALFDRGETGFSRRLDEVAVY